jgi:hypothetical protein
MRVSSIKICGILTGETTGKTRGGEEGENTRYGE